MNEWENQISINPQRDPFEVIYINDIRDALRNDDKFNELDGATRKSIDNDKLAIPYQQDREGYNGTDHLAYWLGGRSDYKTYVDIYKKDSTSGINKITHLDFGCASGRFLRHMINQCDFDAKVYGCDLNRRHVEFLQRYFRQQNTCFFQNTSVPFLPLKSGELDSLTAYSVFSHIDLLETSWLMEFRRVLKTSGIALLSYHPLELLHEENAHLPFYNSIARHSEWMDISKRVRDGGQDKIVIRWKNDASYTANVFLSEEYVKLTWGSIMEIVEIRPNAHGYQSICVLKNV